MHRPVLCAPLTALAAMVALPVGASLGMRHGQPVRSQVDMCCLPAWPLLPASCSACHGLTMAAPGRTCWRCLAGIAASGCCPCTRLTFTAGVEHSLLWVGGCGGTQPGAVQSTAGRGLAAVILSTECSCVHLFSLRVPGRSSFHANSASKIPCGPRFSAPSNFPP